MVLTFATPQDALAALDVDRRFFVTIGGVPTDCISYSGQHDVDQQTATAKLELELPRPAHVVANAAVEVHAGWNNLVGTIFSGYIPAWSGALSRRGKLLTVRPVGWSKRLSYAFRFDLVWQGPVTPREIFVALCEMRGITRYRADTMTALDGVTPIALGTNPAIDGGTVTLPGGRDPLRWLNGIVEPFGYRVFDDLDGTLVLQRVFGLPNTAPVVTFAEGESLAEVERDYDVAGIVNYHDVRGPTYEDAIGATIPIRSIPATIVANPLIPVNDGVAYEQTTNNLLVTTWLADLARNVREIETSAPATPVAWEAIGLPGVGPGAVVAVASATVEASGTYWLKGTDLSVSRAAGLSGRYRGDTGSGTPLAAGTNVTSQALQTAPRHIGDERVDWYAQPAPAGRLADGTPGIQWTITIPVRATAVNIIGWHHGTNSQYIGGSNEDLTLSKWELWRDLSAERPESSGNMPVVDENYAQQLSYSRFTVVGTTVTDPGHWVPFAISLPGTDPGTVTLRLVAGENTKLAAGVRFDDFEVRLVRVDIWGTNEPVILPDLREAA